MHSANDPKKNATASGGEPPRPTTDVGEALRQAYDDALAEHVPDELLDLLKKLD